ncbi:hypothetical protein [Polaribacter sp. SA4-12]|uniref:hypothetical protein n=1 Tax=Polaribacter sp. SA4-12 TaxID=1312072 RepID=UPI000B3C679D|nr:hypothetical protein [Polaribacter sp. SA4-12]ARV15554.1 hypothetical protein BTO07_10560 [Polaribacter sp. SA4-12]
MMKLRFLNTTGALLAFFIGIMSVFSGSLVLFGTATKDYNVLQWLVIYNVIVGVISIIGAYLIWRNTLISKKLILVILGLHFLILFYLAFFSETVAVESIQAMSFRVVIWLIIAIVSILISKYLHKK